MKNKLAAIADFLFEIGIFAKTPRSGFHFLGSGKQSVAEHVHRVVYVGYTLAMIEGDVDVAKVMKMCLFHDLGESRTSDLNYVHQKYNQPNELQAVRDAAEPLPFGSDIVATVEEYEERQSKESIIAKDADQIEWILSLKEQVDTGNVRAESWMRIAIKRLKTPGAKQLADEIADTSSDRWWFGDGSDDWWVTRHSKKKGA